MSILIESCKMLLFYHIIMSAKFSGLMLKCNYFWQCFVQIYIIPKHGNIYDTPNASSSMVCVWLVSKQPSKQVIQIIMLSRHRIDFQNIKHMSHLRLKKKSAGRISDKKNHFPKLANEIIFLFNTFSFVFDETLLDHIVVHITIYIY